MSYYKPGAWNAVCQRCGFEYKSDELSREWTGLMVCCKCFETRHPQTLIQVPEETSGVPWTSPEPTETFIDPYFMEEDPYAPDQFLTELGIPFNTE